MFNFEDCEEWERFVWTETPIPPERIRIYQEATDDQQVAQIQSGYSHNCLVLASPSFWQLCIS
jgi:hypothetical protein